MIKIFQLKKTKTYPSSSLLSIYIIYNYLIYIHIFVSYILKIIYMLQYN